MPRQQPLRKPLQQHTTHKRGCHHSSLNQKVDNCPRHIRGRPLGESIELQSSDDAGDDEAEVCCSRRSYRAAARHGWSHLLKASHSFIQGPDRLSLDERSDCSGSDEEYSDGEDGASAAATEQGLSFFGVLQGLLRVIFWDIIHPDSKFRSGWDVFLILCLMYVALVTTYLLCFEFDWQGQTTFFAVVDILINCAFLLDIFFNFRTAIRRGDDAVRRRQVITDRRKIAVRYLSGWFAVDVLAALPWSYITESLASYMQLLKLLRLLRLLRLLQMSKAMQRSQLYMNMEHMQGAAVARVMSYTIGAVLVLHMSASAWFFVAVLESRDLSGTWAEAAGLQDATNFERYLTSLYFVVVTYTTVGYGDVYPVTTVERFMTCVGMLIGVVTLGYIISTANTIAGKAKKYEVARSELLGKVENFLRAQPLPTDMAARIKSYYEYVARRRFNDQDDARLVATLPMDLRRDVLRAMHSHLVKRIPFLGEVVQQQEALVLEISAALKLEFFSRGECVLMEGGWDTELYFVTEGKFHVCQLTTASPDTAETAGGDSVPVLTAPRGPGQTTVLAAVAAPSVSVADIATPQLQGALAAPGGGEIAATTTVTTTTITTVHEDEGGDAGKGYASGGGSGGGGMDSGGGWPLRQRPRTDSSTVRKWLATAHHDTRAAGPGLHAGPGDVIIEMYGKVSAPTLPPSLLVQQAQADSVGQRPESMRLGEDRDSSQRFGPIPEVDVDGGLGAVAPSRVIQRREVRAAPFPAVEEVAEMAEAAVVEGCSEKQHQDQHQDQQTPPPLVRTRTPAETERRWRVRQLYDASAPSKVLRKLKKGDCFGEYGCLTGCPRTASVIAVQMCEVYCLKRSDLAAAMVKWPQMRAAWKRCDDYGERERQWLRLYLQADHEPNGSMSRPKGDPYDNSPHNSAMKVALNSQKRYQNFLSSFGVGDITAAVVTAAAEPIVVPTSSLVAAAQAQ